MIKITNNTKNTFGEFLRENRFLPLSLWNNLEIEHGIKNKEELGLIKQAVGTKKGLYIYSKNNRILYIGKAKSLFGRIKSHYRESFENVPGDTRWNTWHKFFSQKRNLGLVKIFWKEVGAEDERQILEKILSKVLDPEFKKFRRLLEK